MILVSSQMAKQLSTPRKATKVLLVMILTWKTLEKNYMRKKKEEKDSEGIGNTLISGQELFPRFSIRRILVGTMKDCKELGLVYSTTC